MDPVELNSRLRRLGFRLAGPGETKVDPRNEPDIEETLIEAISIMPQDIRLAGMTLAWLQVHGDRVIVEKMQKLARRQGWTKAKPNPWLTLAAASAVASSSPRWRTLLSPIKPHVHLFPEELSQSAIRLKGATPLYEKVGILVPQGSLRVRVEDVLDRAALAGKHRQYRNRYLFGPCWRADIITAIEGGESKAIGISRKAGCSYEPAHRVLQEYRLARAR